jgi:hypothetical protein
MASLSSFLILFPILPKRSGRKKNTLKERERRIKSGSKLQKCNKEEKWEKLKI